MLNVVTGGTGFLGSHLVRFLQDRGVAVRALLRPGTPPSVLPPDVCYHVGDVRDPSAVRDAFAGATTVFHLAGLVAPFAPRHRYLEINVGGTETVVEACLAAKVDRLVYMSSTVVYGIECDHRGLTEDAACAAAFVAPYEESKVKAEQLVVRRMHETGLPTVILRPGMGWGPRERVVLPVLVRNLRSRLFFMVGNGRNTLGLSYATNIAHASWLAAVKSEAVGQIYNVADGFGITCREFLGALAKEVGLPVRRRWIPKAFVAPLVDLLLPAEPESRENLPPSRAALLRLCALYRDSEPDTNRIRKELGYVPPVDFATGIAETIAWYRQAFPATQAK
ncbi:MAG: NAD-dependent epimerase/dehydratase family protein [Candidatus Methylomirabilota bacterium]|jgi:3beta-hydroxy-delta5-steroid dehydrogenase/steroid delta-isomerase